MHSIQRHIWLVNIIHFHSLYGLMLISRPQQMVHWFSCKMSICYTLCNFLPYSSMKANMSYVDGSAVNNQHMTCSHFEIERICWRLYYPMLNTCRTNFARHFVSICQTEDCLFYTSSTINLSVAYVKIFLEVDKWLQPSCTMQGSALDSAGKCPLSLS